MHSRGSAGREGEEGVLSECSVRFPYPEFRRGQREVAEEVAKTVREGGLLALTAPTGFGKTPAIIYGLLCAEAERVLYLVRTVNEVDPVLRELRRFGASYTFLYSARRMCPLFGREQDLSPEEFWSACRIARIQGACHYFAALEKVEQELVVEALRQQDPPHSKLVVEYLSRSLGVCPFFALRSVLDSSQFVVATYPYYFRPDIFEGFLDPYTYEDFVVVVDEAHSLINAQNMLERRLRSEEVEKAIGEVRKYLPGADEIIGLLEDLRSLLLSWAGRRRTSIERLDKSLLKDIIEELEIIHDVAEHVREKKLEEAILSGGGVQGVKTYITRVEAWLAILALEDSYIFADPVNGEVELVATPMDPAVVVKTPLERARAVILASGTLPEGDFVRELLGVERSTTYIDTELMYGAFIQPKNIYTVVARNVTTKYTQRTPEMFRTIATYVTLIAKLMPGAKLAVYPSYEVMEQIAGKIPLDIPIIVESRRTNIAEVQARLAEEPSALINAVANGKLVEGVEFTIDGENILSTVIIVGVPYPQPDDYTRTRLDVLARRIGLGRAKFYVYTFSTIVKVRQALGRATRSPEDRAAYFLLDYRYLRRDLRRLLRVPYNRVVASIEGLRRAIAEARRVVLGGG